MHAKALTTLRRIVDERPGEDWHNATLAEYVAAHPGTEAAAMAFHSRAFRASHRHTHDGREQVDRLIELLRIVEELESGKFPRSRWTTGAAKLVFEVSFYDINLSQPDAERVLAALLPFLRSHPALTTNPVTSEAYLFMLESTLPEIARQTSGGERTTRRARRVAAGVARSRDRAFREGARPAESK